MFKGINLNIKINITLYFAIQTEHIQRLFQANFTGFEYELIFIR